MVRSAEGSSSLWRSHGTPGRASEVTIATTRKHRWRLREGATGDSPDPSQFIEDRRRILLGPLYCTEEESLLKMLPSIESMGGLTAGAERVVKAILAGEKIFVFADYDVDGISAAAMLRTFFRDLNYPVEVYVPDRLIEGYGLSPRGVERVKEAGGELIITVDNGVSAVDGCRRATELGVDVVITDHHDVPPELPVAAAIINPKLSTCEYPYKYLAGVGVAFHLMAGVRAALRKQNHPAVARVNLRHYLDFVALGTIADMVPLDGVNHILCRVGLEVCYENVVSGVRPGLSALLQVAGYHFDRPVVAEDVGYQLGPRLNAAGRLGSALAAEEVLHTLDRSRARELAELLDAENRERQRIERAITEEANRKVESMGAIPPALVIGDASWHPGVVGLVASRLVEKYYRPVLVFGESNGKFRFSGRSTHAVDLFGLLDAVRDEFLAFGGHFHAIGLTLEPNRLSWLQQYLEENVGRLVRDEDKLKPLDIDATVTPSFLDEPFLEALECLEPFGVNNSRPRWLVSGVHIRSLKRIGKDPSADHARIQVGEAKGPGVWLTAFGMATELEKCLGARCAIDVVVEGKMQVWKGQRRAELRALDFKVRGQG